MDDQRLRFRSISVLWSAFLMAAVLEMVVFALVDPTGLAIGSWSPDARTVYSLTFFVFWGLVALASYASGEGILRAQA